MADQVPYEEIPQTMRDSLDELYTRKGVVIWWNHPHQMLGKEIPRDLWETACGRERVRQLIDLLESGAYG